MDRVLGVSEERFNTIADNLSQMTSDLARSMMGMGRSETSEMDFVEKVNELDNESVLYAAVIGLRHIAEHSCRSALDKAAKEISENNSSVDRMLKDLGINQN